LGRRCRTVAATGAIAAVVVLGGCAAPRQMLAANDDLRDYRAFRVSAHEGRRLFQAQRYLERHPKGAWADEVRAAFETEEAAWFDAAKTSRARAREYIVDLPDGPHVDAARSLLVLFDEHQEDAETLELLAQARRTAATLDYETARRRRVSEVILEEVAALADPATWGARLESPPPALAAALRGEVPRTWGAATHARRQDALFFVVPTPTGAQASVADVSLQLWVDNGRVAEGLVQGPDLFVHWSEALVVRVLDAGNASDRRLASTTVADVLAGAFEATLPAQRCTAPLHPGEILARACDGWTVSVRMGPDPGSDDAIEVHGAGSPGLPSPAPAVPGQPQPAGARSPGMR
jgi:hypothetical protein